MKTDKELFVIPTKEDSYIFECVERINRYHPDADILIVDSDSDNKNYMQTINKNYKNVMVSEFKNKNYEYGAILHGFLNYKDKYDIFFFIQDSIFIKKTIDSTMLEENTAWVFSKFRPCKLTIKGSDPDHLYPDFFNHPKYVEPRQGAQNHVQYNSFIIKSKTFNKCINSEIFSMIGGPKTKIGSMTWETLWTIIFLSNNIEIKFTENQKEYNHVIPYEEDQIISLPVIDKMCARRP
jgi:hypothetical protein